MSFNFYCTAFKPHLSKYRILSKMKIRQKNIFEHKYCKQVHVQLQNQASALMKVYRFGWTKYLFMPQEGLFQGSHFNLNIKEIPNIIKKNIACMNIQYQLIKSNF